VASVAVGSSCHLPLVFVVFVGSVCHLPQERRVAVESSFRSGLRVARVAAGGPSQERRYII
jgi:hypothetical protein